MGISADIIIIVLAALIGAGFARLIRQPLIIGYLIAGFVIGPYSGLTLIHNIHEIEMLAEIGVALLLFALGLEFSLKELTPVRHIALIGTPVQMLLSILFGTGLGLLFGWSWQQSLWLGGLISLSSTMVVLRTLMSRGMNGTLSSRVMIGILIVQDLAIVPLMIILPLLNDPLNGLPHIGIALLKIIAFFIIIRYLGQKIIPVILKKVAGLNNRELFILTVTAIGLGIGYGTWLFGLSFALGAFVAGMLLNESDYGHQALADIIPLRDIFGLLFFTSVGMLFDPHILVEQTGIIAILLIAVLLGKGIIFYMLAKVFKYGNVVPLALGLTMFQIGEFSFVLAREGLASNSISSDFYSLILTVTILSMFLTPFVSALVTPAYKYLKKHRPRPVLETVHIPSEGLADHIVIIGAGRIGANLARILQQLQHPFVLIEYDHRQFEAARVSGFSAVYGDAAQEDILKAAFTASAKLLLITIPHYIEILTVKNLALLLNDRIKIISRASRPEEINSLKEHGLESVIQPEFEATLEFVRQTLLHLNYPALELLQITDTMRRSQYQYSDSALNNRKNIERLKHATQLLDIEWYEIQAGHSMAGLSLKELDLRNKFNVYVLAVSRENDLISHPAAQTVLQVGDTVAIMASHHELSAFKQQCFS